jgi:formylglycine-generating enzyme required for sulfatase activity
MKHFIFIFLLVSLAINSLNAQFSARKIKKELVKINDTLLASKFELTNARYKDFLESEWLNKQPELKAIALIDTTNWSDSTETLKPFDKLYFKHPAFAKYPCVSFSYKAALLYCQWLNHEYNLNSKHKLTFKIPSESEWILAAQAGNPNAKYGCKGEEILDKKKIPQGNFYQFSRDSTGKPVYYGTDITYAGPLNKHSDYASMIAPVNYYRRNAFGIYNITGNVAEMVSGGNIVKGGSWTENGDRLTNAFQRHYSGEAEIYVGLRVFAVKN